MDRNGKQAWPKIRRSLLLSLTFVLWSPGLFAQDLPCVHQVVPVSVTDPSGKFGTSLTAKDFSAQIHGRAVKILSANLDTNPRRIVLVLDASGSMSRPDGRDTNTWKAALGAARDLVKSLPPEHSLAFLDFASRVDWKIDFMRDRMPILQRLDDLQAAPSAYPKNLGRTALWDSVLEAISLFGSPHTGDAIYAITDGEDNQSRAHIDKLNRSLLASGVRLFGLLTDNNNLVRLREADFGPTLRQVAETTGGALVRPPATGVSGGTVLLSPAQLRVALDDLYSRILRFYRLEFELPEPIEKMENWKLEVMDPMTGGKAHFGLAFPRKLLPCDASSSVH